jgi:hypothetical protein
MTKMQQIAPAATHDGTTTVQGPYRTAATSKGVVDGSLSRQWATRPADERFTTLDALRAQVATWADESAAQTVDPRAMRVLPQDDGDLHLALPGGEPVRMTNWSFGQTAGLAGAPAKYLAKLPPKLAAANLQYGLMAREAGEMSAYVRRNGDTVLRAMTGTGYGRIRDVDVVDQIMSWTDGDARWKVPGMIDWSSHGGGTVFHDPNIDVTAENTTLYASDRDVWLFLCQDANPIEVGKLDDGTPDLMFRGVIVTNSEVGGGAFTMRTMLLRGVCFNRNLWGVENVQELRIVHRMAAPDRFLAEAVPMLGSYADGAADPVIAKVREAKALTVASDDDEAMTFLTGKVDLSRKRAAAVMERVVQEEGHPLRSLWDAVQGITAFARSIDTQDDRVAVEAKAGALMDAV